MKKTRRVSSALGALALAAASFTANADVLFTNLGTAAPPASLGGHAVTPFNVAAQAAVPDYTDLGIIPGNPVPGDLAISPVASKRTVPDNGWASSWSHGYTGPVFFVEAGSATLTLPPDTQAFYFYFEGNTYGANTVTVTTNSGATSGEVSVTTNEPGAADGATGFAFHSTAGETITSITISAPAAGGFSVGEFGIDGGPATTCASSGYTGTKLAWCQNICEKDYSGSALKTWIRRWMDRYHDLPYCMLDDGGEPPQEQPPA